MSLVSTGAVLMSTLAVDHRLDGVAKRSRQEQGSNELAILIGAALAIGGPLIAQILKFMRDKKDEKSAEKEATDDPPGFLDTLVPKIVGLFKPDTSAPKTEVSTPLVSTGKAFQKTDIVRAIESAAKNNNQESAVLYAIAKAESGLRPDAQASTSSAAGLFQFTLGTWRYLNSLWPNLGYTDADRMDPEKSANMAALYIQSIRTSLNRILGRDPSVREIYLAYFLGPTGAARFFRALKDTPNALAADLFPSAAASNPNIFYEGGDTNKPLTMAQVMDKVGGKVEPVYAQKKAEEIQSSTPSMTVAAPIMPVPMASIALPPTKAIPVPQRVTPAELPSPSEVAQKSQGQEQVPESGTPLPGAVQERRAPVTYMRDKQDRLIAIRE